MEQATTRMCWARPGGHNGPARHTHPAEIWGGNGQVGLFSFTSPQEAAEHCGADSFQQGGSSSWVVAQTGRKPFKEQ